MAKTKNPATPPPKKPPKGEAAFDIWLHRSLKELYGPVADEPIPPALMKILEEDRDK